MASSLFQTVARTLTSQQSSLISALAKGNPMQAITSILAQNPNMQGTLNNMIQGKDPKEVFYQKCNEMGYNPEDILKLIR